VTFSPQKNLEEEPGSPKGDEQRSKVQKQVIKKRNFYDILKESDPTS